MDMLVYKLVAVVLLSASSMKFWVLREATIHPLHPNAEWWGSLALALFEMILGCWLLTGLWIRTARLVAIALVGAFLFVAAYKVTQQSSSCGCFGRFEVNPVYALILDLVLLFAMWRARPKPSEGVPRFVSVTCIVGIAVVAVGITIWVFENATALARGLSIDSYSHDFGDVEQNAEYTHAFSLVNSSSFAVEVVRITSSCICTTTAGIEGQVIMPGERIAIPTRLATHDNEDQLISRLTLFCRRVGRPHDAVYPVDLVIKANVRPDFRISPLILDFGEVTDYKQHVRYIRLRPERTPDVQVSHLQAGNRAIAARVASERTSEGDIKIVVIFDGSSLNQSRGIDTPIQVITTSPTRRRLSVLATVRFVAPVAVEPEAVVFPADAVGSVGQEIVVTSTRSIQSIDVECTDSEMKVSARMVSPTDWRVRVDCSDESGFSGLKADVQLRVRMDGNSEGAGGVRVVRVPVFRFSHEGARR